MRNIKYIFCVFICCVCLLGVTGCGNEDSQLSDYENHFEENKKQYVGTTNRGMAEDLAVIPVSKATDKDYKASVKAALTVNEEEEKALLSYHVFDKVYPASITKLMTAILTMEMADFDEEVTLSHDITFNEGNVVRSTLKKGDTVTVEGLFNALLVSSDNDCAVILAEHIAGSVEAFVELMNQKAKQLGATGTHYVNPHGLHDDNHYTTAYDLYLIFREAAKDERFLATIGQKDYTLHYRNSQGYMQEEYKLNTNAYFRNAYPIPTGIDVLGGKTGTTSIAKSCLILYTENKDEEPMISVVLGAETKSLLYETMSGLIVEE